MSYYLHQNCSSLRHVSVSYPQLFLIPAFWFFYSHVLINWLITVLAAKVSGYFEESNASIIKSFFHRTIMYSTVQTSWATLHFIPFCYKIWNRLSLDDDCFSFNSMEFSFIYTAPDHNNRHLKVLYTIYNIREIPQQSEKLPWAALCNNGKE